MKGHPHQSDCIILGGGLQGVSVALALAAEGVSSTIIDARPELMSGASLINEGKIHLGFVYAMEEGSRTRELMLRGALSFAPLLDRWCGPLPWKEMVSDPFDYAVMPDSLLSAAEVERSYQELEELLESLALPRDHYLGHRLEVLHKAVTPKPRHRSLANQSVQQIFATAERSVDPRLLARHILKVIQSHSLIEICCDRQVIDARIDGSEVDLCLESPQGAERLRAQRVINCTWESREGLDRRVGLAPEELNYRIKHQVLVQPPSGVELPAPTTMVQGPYGDIVPWPDGQVYLSWYPCGRTYFSSAPPDQMTGAEERKAIAHQTLEAFLRFFPALKGSRPVSCKSGIIVARGSSDVDAMNSGLHCRHDVGIRYHGPWASVDPGKLTTAPHMANQLVAGLLDATPTS